MDMIKQETDSTIVRIKIVSDRADLTPKAVNSIANTLGEITGAAVMIAHSDREKLDGFVMEYTDKNRVDCEFRFFCDLNSCKEQIERLVFKLKLKYDIASYTDVLKL